MSEWEYVLLTGLSEVFSGPANEIKEMFCAGFNTHIKCSLWNASTYCRWMKKATIWPEQQVMLTQYSFYKSQVLSKDTPPVCSHKKKKSVNWGKNNFKIKKKWPLCYFPLAAEVPDMYMYLKASLSQSIKYFICGLWL